MQNGETTARWFYQRTVNQPEQSSHLLFPIHANFFVHGPFLAFGFAPLPMHPVVRFRSCREHEVYK